MSVFIQVAFAVVMVTAVIELSAKQQKSHWTRWQCHGAGVERRTRKVSRLAHRCPHQKAALCYRTQVQIRHSDKPSCAGKTSYAAATTIPPSTTVATTAASGETSAAAATTPAADTTVDTTTASDLVSSCKATVCLFPFTYNGGLFTTCSSNITGISPQSGCMNINYTAAVCDCPAFQAYETTANLTIPGTASTVLVNSIFGWITIFQRVDITFDWNLAWSQFQAQFGAINSNFWLGLENMHAVTASAPYRLRVEMRDSSGLWYSAEYWSFTVGDEASTQYQLNVAGYAGDAGNAMMTATNANWISNGMKFTTLDHDNDLYPSGNCASAWGGGWWHNYCSYSFLTMRNSISWSVGNLVYARMMIKQQ